MKIFQNIFRFIKTDTSNKTAAIHKQYNESGIDFVITGRPCPIDSAEAFEFAVDLEEKERFAALYLAQLVEEGRALLTENALRIPWPDLYEIIDSSEHQTSLELLDLPDILSLRPVLNCRDTLSGTKFEILLDNWILNGRTLRDTKISGAYVEGDGITGFISKESWILCNSLKNFKDRTDAERSQEFHEQAWGRLRALAEHAHAVYESKYLHGTIVITPETLQLQMQKVEALGERVVIVNPTFHDAPDGWLNAFDGYDEVKSHYDFSSPGGRCRVIIPEPVRKILDVIKKEMPGRRVAGAKAEAFIHNPFAMLGESAHEVIDEHEYEHNKAQAGIFPAAFTLNSTVDDGRVLGASLLITEHYPDGAAKSEFQDFANPNELLKFLDKLHRCLVDERQVFPWGEFDLELDGESSRQLEDGRILLHLWSNQAQQTIKFEDVYTIENYGERIEGIGIAKPMYIPLISKPQDGQSSSWTPEDITPCISVTVPGHSGQVIIPLDQEWIDNFKNEVSTAELNGNKEIKNPKLPIPIGISEAKVLVDSLNTLMGAAKNVSKSEGSEAKSKPVKKETLLLKVNFQHVDYEEERQLRLALPTNAETRLPRSKRPEIKLMPHQTHGIAWLQNLLDRSPSDCRGALLADDMGLGKTLQLLSVIGSFYEEHPNAAPTLIVAPVSLLENWVQESQKFFDSTFPKILTLYGDMLHELKQPKAFIDSRLVNEKGITNLLKPDWLGKSKIILMTYETLRDYEFSLAKQDFAIMVCDEAQKIKTPNAMVTLAAKKQKVQFKIACTGTPVENTLSDLWCLFDYIQPGFLGALDMFSRTYRRPIESKTDEQLGAISKLREIIAPQLLRRTKLDIASELPKKIIVSNNEQTNRLEIQISDYQRQLYIDGLNKLRKAGSEEDARKRARLSFEILHFIKAVCAEPYCLPRTRFIPDKSGLNVHINNSPKIGWLIDVLSEIKSKSDKVILFTELREVQNALCHFLKETFDLKPYVINGDTKSRQSLIDKFQAKEGFDVIILSPLAAGFGLNIVKANHVIHFTRTWNPAKEAQATDRAYRIGAKKDVYVYCPTVVAEDFLTFEAKLDELMRRKMSIADDMLNGTGVDISMTDLAPEGPDGFGVQDNPLGILDVDRMDGESFEVICKLLWNKLGYISKVTAKVGDGGIDVVALKNPDGVLIQCKSSGINSNQLGWDAIKEVTGGAAKYQMMHPSVKFSKVAITNQYFNPSAIEQAKLNHVRLIQRNELIGTLDEYQVMRSEFEQELIFL